MKLRVTICFFIHSVLAFGASRAQVGTAEFTLPLPTDSPPVTPIPTIHNVCNGAVLAVDFHPQKRLCLLASLFLDFTHASYRFDEK